VPNAFLPVDAAVLKNEEVATIQNNIPEQWAVKRFICMNTEIRCLDARLFRQARMLDLDLSHE
jgi:hypothetical protein